MLINFIKKSKKIIIFIYECLFNKKKLTFRQFIRLLLKPSDSLVQIYSRYQIFIESKFGTAYNRISDLVDINWFIPAFNAGSGGHLNIFRMIHFLEKFGVKNNVIVVESNHLSERKTKQIINEDYVPIEAEVYSGRINAKQALFSMATEWRTAYPVRDFLGSPIKTYFVQDYEPYFFPPGTDYALAENTYRFGFYGITAGDWIKNLLNKNFGMECESFGFSYDRNLYSAKLDKLIPKDNWKNIRPRVFFYFREGTPRRGAMLGLLALAQLKLHMPEVEIIIAGEENGNADLPFEMTNLGLLPLNQLHDVYKSVDIALVISFSNLSLLPLELMASNCTVLINAGPNNRWGLNDQICAFCDPTIESILNKMIELLKNHTLRSSLRENAIEYVVKTNWEFEAKKVYQYLSSLQHKFLEK